MFGFIIGSLCLVGLVFLLTRPHRSYARGYGHWFSRLDASPGQEKALRTAALDLKKELEPLHGARREVRDDLSRLLAKDTLSVEEVEQSLFRHESELKEAIGRVAKFLVTVHETLDPEQRKKVGDLVAALPTRPFRGAARPFGHGCGSAWHRRGWA